MNTLELKYIAPYLPYNLNVEFEGIVADLEGIDLLTKKSLIIERCAESISDVTPLLRPLSDLTKEIDHNGEKFVPIEKLNELNFAKVQFKSFKHGDYVTLKTSMSGFNLFSAYEQIEKLLEWHFDVFGLIEKGLAKKIR